MHLASVLSAQRFRNTQPTRDEDLGARRGPFNLVFRQDVAVQKLHFWFFLALIVGSSVLCVGMFECTRLTTYVLRSPCTVVSSDVVDVGICTVCDGLQPSTCEAWPIATARIGVTFRPMHSDKNVTGWVWYCKGRGSTGPCNHDLKSMDQLALDIRAFGGRASQHQLGTPSPFPCSTGQIFAYMEMHKAERWGALECYYSSRDPSAEDVWLTMPSVGAVDHQWFRHHMEYPLLLALGGLVLLATLLTCLALEGVELWAAGIVN